jgi:DNA polymerase III alpha subunit
VKNYFLTQFPSPEEMKKRLHHVTFPEYREVNGHIHTPYSFSAFTDLDSLFSTARNEEIKLLGINDFYVTDGYLEFYKGCISNGIFPLFNIEFIGLMKDEQKHGIRINDPNNPGRIYFCGKGLDYPFNLDLKKNGELCLVKEESQNQLRAMVSRLNTLISEANPSLRLNFDEIKNRYAHDLVRERHIAKAVRILAAENYKSAEEQLGFFEKIYGGKKSKAGLSDPASLENEISSNLLKASGAALVVDN